MVIEQLWPGFSGVPQVVVERNGGCDVVRRMVMGAADAGPVFVKVRVRMEVWPEAT